MSESVRARPPAGRVRLTRRGRRVLWGLAMLAAALLAIGMLVAAGVPASQAAGPGDARVPGTAAESGAGGHPAVAVVRPGDTLWSVAARHVPSRDPYGMIEEVRRLNGLSGHTIHPGQQLLLPRR